jgi:hypothetical protein
MTEKKHPGVAPEVSARWQGKWDRRAEQALKRAYIELVRNEMTANHRTNAEIDAEINAILKIAGITVNDDTQGGNP